MPGHIRLTSSDNLSADALASAHRGPGPQAARLNKKTLRALNGPLGPIEIGNACSYADSDEHFEGIVVFFDKRRPAF